MKPLIVIQEIDLDDLEQIVIGVADSVENAEKLINEYYGEHNVVSCEDIRDGNIECLKTLEVNGINDELYKVKIWLELFQLNELNV